MPSSFGRVESHCFGCESVFNGSQAQGIAEDVFQKLVAREPTNPQVHYLQGYLLEGEGRFGPAAAASRQAVQIDGDYLNAWRHLLDLNQHMVLERVDRESATLKLLELDPGQRHVHYDLGALGDFGLLWNSVAAIDKDRASSPRVSPLYRLKKSAQFFSDRQERVPEALRAAVSGAEELRFEFLERNEIPTPPLAMGTHPMITAISELMGADRTQVDY